MNLEREKWGKDRSSKFKSLLFEYNCRLFSEIFFSVVSFSFCILLIFQLLSLDFQISRKKRAEYSNVKRTLMLAVWRDFIRSIEAKIPQKWWHWNTSMWNGMKTIEFVFFKEKDEDQIRVRILIGNYSQIFFSFL